MTAKTVLITGCSRGIGLTLAEYYVKAGWTVIGAVRNPNTAEKLKTLSPSRLVQLDATNEESVMAAAKALEGVAIDLLINNAGIFEDTTLTSTTKIDLMRQFEVNSVGPFLVTRALLPNLKLASKTNGFAIVAQISSNMGSITNNTGDCYGYRASKAAINMINSCLAMDLKRDNIAAIVLHPGYVVTDLTQGKGDIETSDSVAGIVKVLDGVTIEKTNTFYRYDGAVIPW